MRRDTDLQESPPLRDFVAKMTRARRNASSAAEAISRLHRDLKIEPLPDRFGCKCYEDCRKSLNKRLRRRMITGNWPYVGASYGRAHIDGVHRRILVIGMDQGGWGEAWGTTFHQRQGDWRAAFECPDHAHTGGTCLIIQRLMNNKERGNLRRVASAFAHTNSVKCSPRKVEGQGMRSESTAEMRQNCQRHLKREIGLLKPDLVIAEGMQTTAMVREVLELPDADWRFKERGGKNYCEVYQGQPTILAVPHPARKKGLRWSKGELPSYYLDAIDKARESLSG